MWQGKGSGDAVHGGHLASGPDRQPRAHPALSNVTLATGGSGHQWSKGAGLRLRHGTALTARQMLVLGFGGGVLAVGPRSWQLLEDGVSTVSDSAQWNNSRPLRGWNAVGAKFRVWSPKLRNAGTDPNHGPCPESVLPARGDPPGQADFVGAFGQDNRLKEWTVSTGRAGPRKVSVLRLSRVQWWEAPVRGGKTCAPWPGREPPTRPRQ